MLGKGGKFRARRRGEKFHRFIAFGVSEGEMVRVKSDGRAVRGSTVATVPDKRKLAGRKLHADLMRSSCQKMDANQGAIFFCGEKLIGQLCLLDTLSFFCDNKGFSFCSVVKKKIGEVSARLVRNAAKNGEIVFLECAFGDLPRKMGGGTAGSGKHHKPRGIAVQTMHGVDLGAKLGAEQRGKRIFALSLGENAKRLFANDDLLVAGMEKKIGHMYQYLEKRAALPQPLISRKTEKKEM